MTEFSTNNDSINQKTHFSQPLQNSPRHFNSSHNISNLQQHYLPYQIQQQQQQQQQNSSFKQNSNLLTNHNTKLSSSPHKQPPSLATTPQSSATNSPLHYRNPFNSPNNSPFATSHVSYQNSSSLQQQQQQQQQQLQLQQYLYRQKLSLLSQNQYQQHLQDILQQQQHLQKLLSAKDKVNKDERKDRSSEDENDCNPDDEDHDGSNENDEISEESLKQNVAIVLNNLDRYNHALRSVILNEQINSNSSLLFDESLLLNSNHNFLFSNSNPSNGNGNNNNNSIGGISNSNNNNLNKKMASATTVAAASAVGVTTPESDYNSNATTPGSRCNMLPYDSNMQQQQQQNNMVGFNVTTVSSAAAANATAAGVTSLNNMGCVGGGNGFASNNQYANSFGNNGFCNNIASLSNNLNCSLASSHDYTHDNSDYQWFIDYGYRDGSAGMQKSVLSSLSASYDGFGDLVYYEDLAKNLDANLAEVDMESFKAEDIHSLLSRLPTFCKNLAGHGATNGLGDGLLLGAQTSLEQSFNLMMQQEQQQNMLPALGGAHNMSTTSSNEPIDNSICKSELLFSPLKESHLSVDTMDMDAYPDDADIILTCQANKDNYTIAFQGSMLYSDESFYEPNEVALKNTQNFLKFHHNHLQDMAACKALEVSMAQSNQDYTPNMNQQNNFNINQLQRCPSGNNNTNINTNTIVLHRPKSHCAVRKSSSLPNLHDSEDLTSTNGSEQVLYVSEAISTSTMEQCKSRNLLPMCQMPISVSASISEQLSSMCQSRSKPQYHQSNQQHHHNHHSHHRHKHRCCCSQSQHSNQGAVMKCSNASNTNQGQQCQQQQHQLQKQANISGSASSGNSNPAAFNLVKLFIKQKSSNCSSDDGGQVMSSHTCMDVSSGCWPSSEAVGSSSSSSLEQRLRKKSMHDSGKGSALSRHDEEELCDENKDSSDKSFPNEHSTPKKSITCENVFYDEDQSSSSSTSLTATNSPAHRKRSMPLRNPQLHNVALQNSTGGSSTQSTDASHSNSEQLTQIYAASGSAAVERRRSRRSMEKQRPNSTASSSEMITRSMQTSCSSISTRSSVNDRLRCVPPSFLSKLSKLGEERQAPIYVIYPNYALPDLGFVKTGSSPDVIFSPFNYKMTFGSAAANPTTGLKKRFSLSNDDDELLKTMDYKHVVDWESLATLLPIDYRRRLKHIPEVNSILPMLEAELSHKPLFCMTPPVRRNKPNVVCDCSKYLQSTFEQQQKQNQTQVQEGSSSSGSSHQPSSGYRGSSTLLTDSELETTADPLKQMYIYQYEQQKMDSGVESSPGSATKPTPMPRGILRKTNSQASARTKRNSMIEDQNGKMSKMEKRRSLQEPPNSYGLGSAEELTEVFEEEGDLYAETKPRKERLSRKDLDARARAESFLSSIPRSELKYYAEIAAILESSEQKVEYDAVALKKEVSRVLSQQKKVSFNDEDKDLTPVQEHQPQLNLDKQKRFSTPPNSPNISLANAGLRSNNGPAAKPRRLASHLGPTLDDLEMRKIESNRFKRLQIQWELMSKETSMLKEIVNAQATKSGGSTPTSSNASHKSRIPRPVSYPAGKSTDDETPKNIKPMKKCDNTSKKPSSNEVKTRNTTIKPSIVCPPRNRITGQDGKTTARSPSRIVPPKRYSIAGTPSLANGNPSKSKPTSPAATPTGPSNGATFTANRSRAPNSRASVTAPTTPKKRIQSPRTTTRAR